MRSISPLLAVQFTLSKRAGSLASSRSIFMAVKPCSLIQGSFLSDSGSERIVHIGVAVDANLVAKLTAQEADKPAVRAPCP